MNQRQIITIAFLVIVIGISGAFIAMPSSSGNPISTVVSSSTTSSGTVLAVVPKDLATYGSVSSLNAVAASINSTLAPSSSAISSVSPVLSLSQVRTTTDVIALVYNGTSPYVPGYDSNFSLIILEENDGTQGGHIPVHDTVVKEVSCSWNTAEYPANATTTVSTCSSLGTLTTFAAPSGLYNFTGTNGELGWGYNNYLTWWNNGLHYEMLAGNISQTQMESIANSMEPVSSTR